MPRPTETRRTADLHVFQVRLPAALHSRLVAKAAENQRSVNGEVVFLIRQHVEDEVAA